MVFRNKTPGDWRKIIHMHEFHSPHQHWMQQAIETARQALPQDVPVGALLLHHGQIIAQAYNRREIDQNPVGHAELLVLQEAAQYLGRWRLQETILYVTLEPCPMCASAIQQARVGQVVYGAADPVMGACGSRYGLLLNSPELPVISGVLEEPCGQLLRTFFERLRNKQE
jgi:tRNA(adenine34) deaminase